MNVGAAAITGGALGGPFKEYRKLSRVERSPPALRRHMRVDEHEICHVEYHQLREVVRSSFEYKQCTSLWMSTRLAIQGRATSKGAVVALQESRGCQLGPARV